MCAASQGSWALLRQQYPSVHRWLVRHHCETTAAPQLAPSADTLDPGAYRATTLVMVNPDQGIFEVAPALGGECNLAVVVDDPAALVALLAHPRSEELFHERRMRLLTADEVSREGLPLSFLLGSLKVVALACLPRNRTSAGLLRAIKQADERRQTLRQQTTATYMTMVTYNRLEFTRRTLNRLKLNTERPLKLVVVDNGSSDGTVRWLEENQGNYPFIERIMPMSDNLGIGRALNNGLRYSLSRSRRVGRIDNDILVPPFWLRDLLHVLESPLNPWIVSGFVTDDRNVRALVRDTPKLLIDDLKVYLVEAIGGGCNLYAPDIFARIGYFLPEHQLYGVEDGGLCAATRSRDGKIAVVDNVKLEHLSTIIAESVDYKAFKAAQVAAFQRDAVDEHVQRLRGLQREG